MAQEKISHHQWKHVSFTNIDFSFNFSLKFSSPHLQLEGDDDEADEAAGERGVGSLGILIKALLLHLQLEGNDDEVGVGAGERGVGSLGIIMEAGSSFILFLPELVS